MGRENQEKKEKKEKKQEKLEKQVRYNVFCCYSLFS